MLKHYKKLRFCTQLSIRTITTDVSKTNLKGLSNTDLSLDDSQESYRDKPCFKSVSNYPATIRKPRKYPKDKDLLTESLEILKFNKQLYLESLQGSSFRKCKALLNLKKLKNMDEVDLVVKLNFRLRSLRTLFKGHVIDQEVLWYRFQSILDLVSLTTLSKHLKLVDLDRVLEIFYLSYKGQETKARPGGVKIDVEPDWDQTLLRRINSLINLKLDLQFKLSNLDRMHYLKVNFKMGNYKDVLNFIQTQFKEGKVDVFVVNIRLACLVKLMKLAEFDDTFQHYFETLGFVPDQYTISYLIDYHLLKNDREKAYQLLDTSAIQSYEVQQDLWTFNLWFQQFAKNQDFRGMSLVLQSMQNFDLEPDIKTLSMVLASGLKVAFDCTRNPTTRIADIDRGGNRFRFQLQFLYDLFVNLHQNRVQVDAQLYLAFINYFTRLDDLEKATQVLNTMQKYGVKPQLPHLSTLLVASARKGDLRRTVALFNHITQLNLNLRFNKVVYTAVLEVYSKHVDMDLTKVMELIEEGGFVPDLVSYNKVLYSLLRAGKFSDALEVLNDMQHSQIKPDHFSLLGFFKFTNLAIDKIKCSEYCADILGDFKSDVLPILDQAYSLFAEYEIPLHPTSANLILTSFVHLQSYETALQVYRKLVEEGVTPGYTTLLPLLQVSTDNLTTENILVTATSKEDAVERQLYLKATLHKLISAHKLPKARRLLERMASFATATGTPYPVDTSHFERLLVAYTHSFQYHHLVPTLELALRNQVPVSSQCVQRIQKLLQLDKFAKDYLPNWDLLLLRNQHRFLNRLGDTITSEVEEPVEHHNNFYLDVQPVIQTCVELIFAKQATLFGTK